jgi:hypothetical protein
VDTAAAFLLSSGPLFVSSLHAICFRAWIYEVWSAIAERGNLNRKTVRKYINRGLVRCGHSNALSFTHGIEATAVAMAKAFSESARLPHLTSERLNLGNLAQVSVQTHQRYAGS